MKNFIFFIILVTILIVIGGFFISEVKKEKSVIPDITTYEYFWSEDCPHCAKVAEFMNGWEKKDRFDVQKFEVNSSTANAKLFVQRGYGCKISQNDLGVPLLVTPVGECITGDQTIIEYLKNLDL